MYSLEYISFQRSSVRFFKGIFLCYMITLLGEGINSETAEVCNFERGFKVKLKLDYTDE